MLELGQAVELLDRAVDRLKWSMRLTLLLLLIGLIVEARVG